MPKLTPDILESYGFEPSYVDVSTKCGPEQNLKTGNYTRHGVGICLDFRDGSYSVAKDDNTFKIDSEEMLLDLWSILFNEELQKL